MLKKLLSWMVALSIAVTGAVAGLNFSPPALAATPVVVQTEADRETAQFRQLLIDYYAAWSIPDRQPWSIAAAEQFYQHTDRLFGFDFNPPAEGFQGWEAYKRELTKIISNYSKFRVTLGDRFKVYRNGNVVWTVSTFEIAGTLKNGSPLGGSGRNTLVWERIGDRWLIAHEHISTPLVPPSK